MMGGFEIVDYSDSINQLHKKLLTKILLNKWFLLSFSLKAVYKSFRANNINERRLLLF